MLAQEPSRRSRSCSNAVDKISCTGVTFDDDNIDTSDYEDENRDSEHVSFSLPSEVVNSVSCVVLDSITSTPDASVKPYVIKDTLKKHVPPKEIRGKASGHTKCREEYAYAIAIDRGDYAILEAKRQNHYLRIKDFLSTPLALLGSD